MTAGAPGAPRPDFVIIGAQKSGSTALMRYLGDHPQVYLPEQETRYFRDPWFHFESADVLTDAVTTSKPGVLRRGIKCPDYLAQPACPGRILELLGKVDLLAVLRDPVERAVSAYFWGMQWGWVPLAPVDVGLGRLLDGDIDPDYPRSREVLEYGRYGAHLSRYYDVFPAERITVLLDEDLRLPRRDATLREVFTRLSVDPSVRPVEHERRVNEGVYSARRLRLLQYRHRYILREFPGYPGEKFLQPAVGVRGRLVNRAVSSLDRLVLRRIVDNTRPAVAPEVRERLRGYYRADVAVLADLLGRPLDAWT